MKEQKTVTLRGNGEERRQQLDSHIGQGWRVVQLDGGIAVLERDRQASSSQNEGASRPRRTLLG